MMFRKKPGTAGPMIASKPGIYGDTLERKTPGPSSMDGASSANPMAVGALPPMPGVPVSGLAGSEMRAHQANSSFIREAWIEKQLHARVKEFTEEKKIIVHIGTWNVNAKKPTEDLHSWLCLDTISANLSNSSSSSPNLSGVAPDVYVVGFQEIVDLNAGNLLVDHNAAKPWEDKIEKTMKQQYQQICSRHLVGLSLCVYVKRELYQFMSDLQFDSAGVGIMGVGGNKGAVAIRFQLFDSSFVFVNSHLAAHQNNVAGRNSDFHNICQRIKFTDRVKKTPFSLYDHDFVFWLGDLNYRINVTDMNLVYSRIDAQDWPFLLAHDQLLIEKAAGNSFKKFKEGAIEFAPTYKYQPGTPLYERREDKKKRLPAWCDRIQWIGDDVKQLVYQRAELLCSDHKPVYALFDVGAKVLVPEKKKAVHAALGRQLDAWENECIPKVTMSPASIVFPDTAFDVPATAKLKIENTGQVVVQFHFTAKPNEEAICKPWLKVAPEFGIIPPGQALEVLLTVHVTRETALPLTSGLDSLEDILIFRLENGRDYFVTVAGQYLKSCFGASVEYLTPSPVRLAPPSSKDLSSSSNSHARVLSMPKELWRLVDYIFKHGMDCEALFITNGVPAEIEACREALDNGHEFQPVHIHSVAECLIRFLEALAEPIFPVSLVNQYQEGQPLTAWCKQALMQLSPCHYNAFIYMVSFLRELLKHSAKNKLTAVQLVLVFASALMHCEPPQGDTGKDKPKAWVILRHFLTSDDFI